MSEHPKNFFYNIEKSLLVTLIGIIVLFSGSVIVTLIAPSYIDPTWTEPSSLYQVQMYEVSDPNIYISSVLPGSSTLQYVYHIKKDYTLLSFQESDTLRIKAPPELEQYVTRYGEAKIKLTTRLLLVRKAGSEADSLREELKGEWKKNHPDWKEKKTVIPVAEILELYEPQGKEAFALAPTDSILENWVDENFVLMDDPKHKHHRYSGLIYVNNPIEYKISSYQLNDQIAWRYNPKGETVTSIEQLKSHGLGFRSREELIKLGEHIYAIEGCWYCHTDQTRTLVQDVVLNGSDSFPAPPSSANEYIYQWITFPGTRRIGPDLSRVGIKRPSRDWHKGHFWSPKTASKGSIMPAFRHFFDNDPRGTSRTSTGIPNYQFEAVYQYLMTKGTRITPPTQAWWLGLDPIKTIEIIEGQRKLQ